MRYVPATTPLVTVGMAVYNGQEYIAEALASVQAETYANWELLAVNDCSSDSSVDIIRSLDEPRIRLIENEENLGLVGVRNLIMQEARGTYVAWLDQDDLTFPARMSRQVEYLERNPGVSVCGSWTETRTEQPDGSFVRSLERLPSSHAELRAAMLFLNPVACNTVMMRREPFVSRGLAFRPEFGNSLDYDLWSVASDSLTLHNIPAALAAYRVHGTQTSRGAELERMNGQALRIQSELAERALGIRMSDEDLRSHRLATVSPVIIDDPADLDAIERWFGRLRSANETAGAFDLEQFDRAVARQWTTAALGWRAAGASAGQTLARAAQGLRAIGVSRSAAVGSIAAGMRRRLSRRPTHR